MNKITFINSIMAAAAALLPIAGRLALGLGASALIDRGIHSTIPYGIHKAKEITSKYKLTHGLSNVLGKVEKGYNSKAGKIGQNVASLGGSIAAFGGSGALFKGAGMVGAGLRSRLAPAAKQVFKPISKIGKRIKRSTTKVKRGQAQQYYQSKIKKNTAKMNSRPSEAEKRRQLDKLIKAGQKEAKYRPMI
jgi:hypothetical protein